MLFSWAIGRLVAALQSLDLHVMIRPSSIQIRGRLSITCILSVKFQNVWIKRGWKNVLLALTFIGWKNYKRIVTIIIIISISIHLSITANLWNTKPIILTWIKLLIFLVMTINCYNYSVKFSWILNLWILWNYSGIVYTYSKHQSPALGFHGDKDPRCEHVVSFLTHSNPSHCWQG